MQLGSSLKRRRGGRDRAPGEDGAFRGGGVLRRLVLPALGLAVGGLGFGYLFATQVLFPAPPPPGDLFAVPDVRGMDLATAGARLDQAGLSLGTVEPLRHPEVDSGSVVGQAPVPGQLAPPNGAVRITLSLGPERQPVPDLLGLRGDWAANVLEATGFSVTVDSAEATAPRGRVLEIEPGPGTELALPGEVVVRVSTGPPRVAIPDLAGLTEEAARDTLSTLGLVVGEVQDVFRFGRDQGLVIGQAPPADSLVERGTAVRFSVGRRGGGGQGGGPAPDAGTGGGNKRPRQP